MTSDGRTAGRTPAAVAGQGESGRGADYPSRVGVEDFAGSFGVQADALSQRCRSLIESTDFRYRVLRGDERDEVILQVLQKLALDRQVIGTEERTQVWQDGWSENLRAFSAGGDLRALIPQFIRPRQVVRFAGEYIRPANPDFELDYFSVFRLWLFETYLAPFEHVYEFGCGTGFNLVALGQLFPEKNLYGLDFVPSAVELVNRVGASTGLRLTGRRFNMVSPDPSLRLADRSAVLTIGSVEQLASQFEAFLEFLLAQRPGLCINVEPTVELYDEARLLDYLAALFHRKRGYTEGLLPRLRELDKQGRLKLGKVKRLGFGSLMMEGYSCFVWETL